MKHFPGDRKGRTYKVEILHFFTKSKPSEAGWIWKGKITECTNIRARADARE